MDKEVYDTDERLRRLYKLIEDGVTEQDDILRDRLTALKADRDRAHFALQRARAGVRPAVDLSPALIERFGQTMRDKLTSGEIPFRKAYLGAIVDRIKCKRCSGPTFRPGSGCGLMPGHERSI